MVFSSPQEAGNQQPTSKSPTPNFDSVRAILLSPEWERLQALEEENAALRQESQAQIRGMQTQIALLQDELESLRQEVAAESAALETRLLPKMSHLIAQTIRDARDEMAEILGPVIGEAIRVQIRDSRQTMVETLSPIILETVQRAISAFVRELQRNIDARLRHTFGAEGLRRVVLARLRGVSPSELTLRDAFPFEIQELFVIQHESGLLLAHQSMTGEYTTDSDLISGMLTAIRDFVSDSFGDGTSQESLWEVEFGDGERIIIQSGHYAYLAAVITGIEPAGFRSQLHKSIADLHIQHQLRIRDYVGDPQTLPDLSPYLQSVVAETAPRTAEAPKPMSRQQKLLIAVAGLSAIFFASMFCVYLQFTIALWPLAFGSPTPIPSPATGIDVPVSQPASTLLSSPPSLPPPLPMPTPPLLPATTANSQTNSPVWARSIPDPDAPPIGHLAAGTVVTLTRESGDWAEVTWDTRIGRQRAWIPLSKISLDTPVLKTEK
jgi:hypothetical protein